MADNDSSKVRFDDVVSGVHADPANAQPTFVLSGFVGPGASPGRVRVYHDLSLNSWHEVGEDDILHSRPHPPESSPHGGSHVWVKHGAAVQPGSTAPPAAAAGPFGHGAPYSVHGSSCGIACTYVDCMNQALRPGPATPPNTIYPQQTCGYVCHTQQDCPGQYPPAAQFGGGGAPYTVYPQQTCGFVCHTQEDCPRGGVFTPYCR